MKLRTACVCGALAWTIAGTTVSFGANFSAWQKKMQITFAGYVKAETLTNFPALVVLGTNVSGFLYSDFASAEGADLRFSDETQTNELAYEIEKWNTNGTSYIWVHVPTIVSNSGASASYITMYYGNADQTNQQAYTTNGAVWVNGYASVWHMNQISAATDSTANRNDLVNTSVTATSSPIGGAAHFNGSSAKFEKATSASLTIASNITMSAWVRYSAASEAYNTIIEKDTASAYVYGLFVKQTVNTLATYFHNNGTQRAIDGGGTAISTGVWTHVTATWDSSTIRTFLNGGTNQSGVAAAASWTPPDGVFSLGHSKYGSGRWLNGDLDEVRISSIPRSADWIWAEWMNMASNSTFNTYGSVQTQQGPVFRGW